MSDTSHWADQHALTDWPAAGRGGGGGRPSLARCEHLVLVASAAFIGPCECLVQWSPSYELRVIFAVEDQSSVRCCHFQWKQSTGPSEPLSDRPVSNAGG